MATTASGTASGTMLPPKMADPIKLETTTTTTTLNQEEHIARTNKPPSLFKKRGGSLRNKKKWKQASRSHGSSEGGKGDDDNDDAPIKKEEDEKQKDADDAAADDDDDVEPSALESIRSIKQRRKIRNSLTASRGVDALSLLQGGNHGKQRRRRQNQMEAGNDGDENNEDDEANAPLRDRLYGSFAGGTGADAADGMGEGVMGKKHHDAMEAYIQKQMGHESLSSASASSNSRNSNNNDNKNVKDGGGPRMATTAQMEAQLYEELLATTTTGAMQRGGEDEASGKVANKGTAAAEGDVGAGGAVLGGTGIAEVELPVEERIENVKRTEQAAAARARQYHPHNRKRNVSENKQSSSETRHAVVEEMLPTNFGAGPSKRKKTQGSTGVRPVGGGGPSWDQKQQEERGGPSASSAGAEVLREDVSGLGASYSHNFKLHTHEWVHKRKEEREAELQAELVLQLANEGTATNRQRMGFDAARRVARGQIPLPTPHHATEQGSTGTRTTTTGAATATGGNATNNRDNSNFQKSNDDRVWKTFMARQRGRR